MSEDRWSDWVLKKRFGDDPAYRDWALQQLRPVRDRVLERARIEAGYTALDVGTGDGFLAFEALQQVGLEGQVIFSDVSHDLLAHCQRMADQLAVSDRCRFLCDKLPFLASLRDDCVDVALLRSVLIYVQQKEEAMVSIKRILRPGGRVSIFEPINSFGRPEPRDTLWGFDCSGLESVATKVKDVYEDYRSWSPSMDDFDERDLFTWALDAGFSDVRLEYHAESRNRLMSTGEDQLSVESIMATAPNPNVPAPAEVLPGVLGERDYERLVERLRCELGSGRRRVRSAVVYLAATCG